MANNEYLICRENVPEFVGEIIDVFEDFLDVKGIHIFNEEREDDDPYAAHIYGSDYDSLEFEIKRIINLWKLAEPDT